MDKRYGISWGGVLTNLADPVKLVYGIIIEAPGNFFRNIRIGAGDITFSHSTRLEMHGRIHELIYCTF